jgi:hypothetical protein
MHPGRSRPRVSCENSTPSPKNPPAQPADGQTRQLPTYPPPPGTAPGLAGAAQPLRHARPEEALHGDGEVELSPVPVFRRLAQVADVDRKARAVDQDVDRLVASG